MISCDEYINSIAMSNTSIRCEKSPKSTALMQQNMCFFSSVFEMYGILGSDNPKSFEIIEKNVNRNKNLVNVQNIFENSNLV